MVGSASTLLLLDLFGWYPQLPGWYPLLLLHHSDYDHGPSRPASGRMVLHYLLSLFRGAAKMDGIFSLPKTSIMTSLAPPALSVWNFQVVSATFAFCFSCVRMIVPLVFLTLPACSLI